MNKEKIIDQFCEVLNSRNYNYDRWAVSRIVERSMEAKKELYEMFRKHPKWDEEQLCIHFDQDYERRIETEKYYSFLQYLREKTKIKEIIVEKRTRRSYWATYEEEIDLEEIDLSEELMKIPEQILLPEAIEGTDYADALKAINSQSEKFNFRPGMKLTRVIGKICKEYGFDKEEEFDKQYAIFCDALTPLKASRHTTISINPIDFLLMSNGNSGWTSCHDIKWGPDSAGCYSSGTISYMLGEDSFILSTIDKNAEGDMALYPKIQRQVFAYKDYQLLQSRLYPQNNDSGAEHIYKQTRELVEEIIANAVGEPNRWVKCENWEVRHWGTAYPDWEYGNSKCVKLRTKEDYPSREIFTDDEPICVVCGERHEKTNCIMCGCECHVCYECGELLDMSSESNYVYDEYNERYYCTNCRRYCERCGRIERPDETYWISDVEEDWCERCVDYYAFVCDDCGEYYSDRTENYRTANGGIICEGCREDYEECAGCGKLFHIDEMEQINGKSYCENCAEEHKEGEEESA